MRRAAYMRAAYALSPLMCWAAYWAAYVPSRLRTEPPMCRPPMCWAAYALSRLFAESLCAEPLISTPYVPSRLVSSLR